MAGWLGEGSLQLLGTNSITPLAEVVKVLKKRFSTPVDNPSRRDLYTFCKIPSEVNGSDSDHMPVRDQILLE